ncbi:hypothetical protein ABENE_13430 [Asticcacaulis benevestitus DSM 16100 = ATCC BAA-896]|uniref:Uncharacterized protein n=1 Tax=Asticcacaulis benevestitus DSM 16100 = ATCC BAA-896 TaxID=1121022 RepID=V4PNB9_9CAUL|nr:hypothetical protein ABENE_13430 [Asticcacaulis benevestitus DSM 16100 = ATCC BAA-896]
MNGGFKAIKAHAGRAFVAASVKLLGFLTNQIMQLTQGANARKSFIMKFNAEGFFERYNNVDEIIVQIYIMNDPSVFRHTGRTYPVLHFVKLTKRLRLKPGLRISTLKTFFLGSGVKVL